MLESRIFGPDEDSSRDSGKKNRTYAASLTVRGRWGRIRFRDASQEAQYQRHVLDEDIRLSIRFLRIFFLVFAFGAVCFITMNGAFGRLGNDYLEVPHSAAAQCRRRRRPRARLARARARPRPQAPLLGLHPCLRGMDVFLSVRESPARQREGRSPAPWRWPWELPRRHTPSPQHPHTSRSPPRRLLRAQNLDGRFDLWFAINWEGPVLGSLAVIMLVLVLPVARKPVFSLRPELVRPLVHLWFTLVILALAFACVYPKALARELAVTRYPESFGDADATPPSEAHTDALNLFVEVRVKGHDQLHMFNSVFFLGAVIYLFQPGYMWGTLLCGTQFVVFIATFLISPLSDINSEVYRSWVATRIAFQFVCNCLFLIGTRVHERTRRHGFILMTLIERHNVALREENIRLTRAPPPRPTPPRLPHPRLAFPSRAAPAGDVNSDSRGAWL